MPRKGSKSFKAVERLKHEEAQAKKPAVKLGDEELENVLHFPYLGHHTQADGDNLHAVEIRLAIASSRFKELYNVWGSKDLTQECKLRLYISGVCSILTHAFEAWKLTEQVQRRLRGWNGRYLAVITSGGCEMDHIRLQTDHPVFDLVAMLRVRRLRWLGHVLRMDESRLERQVLLKFDIIYPDGYPEGSILMDAPAHNNIRDLIPKAGAHGPGNHDEWEGYVHDLQAKLKRH